MAKRRTALTRNVSGVQTVTDTDIEQEMTIAHFCKLLFDEYSGNQVPLIGAFEHHCETHGLHKSTPSNFRQELQEFSTKPMKGY